MSVRGIVTRLTALASRFAAPGDTDRLLIADADGAVNQIEHRLLLPMAWSAVGGEVSLSTNMASVLTLTLTLPRPMSLLVHAGWVGSIQDYTPTTGYVTARVVAWVQGPNGLYSSFVTVPRINRSESQGTGHSVAGATYGALYSNIGAGTRTVRIQAYRESFSDSGQILSSWITVLQVA